MTLKDFRNLLLTVMPEVFHYYAGNQSGRHLVWMEYDADGEYFDNRRIVKIQKIWIELYTPDGFDPVVDTLETVLTDAGVRISGPETDYNTETKITLHRWECEVILSGQT